MFNLHRLDFYFLEVWKLFAFAVRAADKIIVLLLHVQGLFGVPPDEKMVLHATKLLLLPRFSWLCQDSGMMIAILIYHNLSLFSSFTLVRRSMGASGGRISASKSCILGYYPLLACFEWGKSPGTGTLIIIWRCSHSPRKIESATAWREMPLK